MGALMDLDRGRRPRDPPRPHRRRLGRARATARGSTPTSRSAAASTRPGSTSSPKPSDRSPAATAPADFIDARRELEGPGQLAERSIERVDPAWLDAVARLADRDVDAVAGRWIDLVEEDLGELPREEKPWIRELAGQIVQFARAADRSQDVIFAWAL